MKSLLLLLLLTFIFPGVTFAHGQDAIIIITSEGFKPESVTITAGSKVTFINSDKESHWPASDSHPTHDNYPQFDPTEAISPDKTWIFIPEKQGTWGYHDHLNHNKKGKLIVGKDPNHSGLNQIFDKLKANLNNLITAIKNYFTPVSNKTLAAEEFKNLSPDKQLEELKKLTSLKGSIEAWKYIRKNYTNASGISGNVHDLAHLSGGLIYSEKGFDGLSLCSPEFAFGCFHGFLDKAFAKNIDKLQEAGDACKKLDRTLSGPVASCIHGIGHGVASFYSVNDLNKALSTCRKLLTGSEYCFDGVFMEFARSAPESFYKKDDPLYPCNSLEKEYGYSYSSACGRNQTTVLMSRFNMKFPEVVEACLSSNSKPFKEACIDSLGFSLAALGDVGKIIEGCGVIGEEEYIARCTNAAAGELVFQEVPGWDQKSKEVCNSLLDPKECLQYVEGLVLEYKRARN